MQPFRRTKRWNLVVDESHDRDNIDACGCCCIYSQRQGLCIHVVADEGGQGCTTLQGSLFIANCAVANNRLNCACYWVWANNNERWEVESARPVKWICAICSSRRQQEASDLQFKVCPVDGDGLTKQFDNDLLSISLLGSRVLTNYLVRNYLIACAAAYRHNPILWFDKIEKGITDDGYCLNVPGHIEPDFNVNWIACNWVFNAIILI